MTLFLTASEKKALKHVIALLDVDKRGFAFSVLLGALTLGASIALSATSAWLIARAAQHPPVLYLTVAAVGVRLFGITRALMRYLQRLASHKVALSGMDSLRQNLYEILSMARVARVASLKRGDLLARTGADVDDVGDLIVKSVLPTVVTTVVGVGTVIGIALLSPAAAAILAGCLLISGIVTPLLTMHATRLAEMDSRTARTDLAELSMTIMDGAAELQVSGRLAEVHERLSRVEDSLVDATARAARPAGLALGIDRAAMGLAVVGALLVGIPETTSGMVAAVALAVLALVPLAAFEGTTELAPAAAQLIRSAAAAERIDDLLGDDQPLKTHSVPLSPTPRLIARDLSIGWPGGPVIATGIDLNLEVGSHLAIVGPSGIGKSTLLYTLAGMLPPVSGTVTLNGVDVWAGSRSDVTAHVTMTAEDAHIFATTVYENIRVANADITTGQAAALLGRAGLGPWLDSLPAGLDTLIGSGGTTVSGGERRRLLLARALASPAPLLLLDEPGEHLDAQTADRLMETLLSSDDATRGTLVVTHRLSALHRADAVLIIDHPSASTLVNDEEHPPATVVERGTHSELAAHRDSYRWAVEQETR